MSRRRFRPRYAQKPGETIEQCIARVSATNDVRLAEALARRAARRPVEDLRPDVEPVDLDALDEQEPR